MKTLKTYCKNLIFGRHGRMGKAFLLITSSLLGFAFSAYAADEEVNNNILEEVIVTATKVGETKLQDTPISITAISGEQLNNSNARYMEDLTAIVPNAVFETFGPGRVIGYIRGVGSSNTVFGSEQNVAFYLDGVFLTRGIGANASFLDVERIEVLRGPQGTLYGRNATSGAVNIVTRMPTDEPELRLGLKFGNYGERQFDGTISGPLVEGKVRARVTFSDGYHDPYMKNTVGKGLYEENYTATRGVLDFTPTDKLEIVLSGDYFNSDSQGQRNRLMSDTGLPAIVAGLMGIPRSTYLPDDFWTTAQDFDSNLEYDLRGVSAKINYDLRDNLSFHSITAYRDTSVNLAEDLDSTPVALFDVVNFLTYKTFTQEVNLIWTTDSFNWIFGAYYFDEQENIQQPNTFHFIIPGLVQDRRARIDSQAWAVFTNLSYDMTDKLSIEAGVRYSFENKDLVFHEATTNIPFPPFIVSDPPESKDWDAITPRFGINYHVSDDAMLYGIISRGFKSGAFSQANPPGLKWVNPEFLWNYELGVKSDWLQNRLRVNGALFYYDYTDLQTRTLGIQGHIVTNAAAASVKGVELEVLARPYPALTINGSVSYLDAKYDKFLTLSPSRQPVDVSGNPLPNAPEWKVVFGAQYEIPLSNYGLLTFGGDVTWIDNMFFSQFANPMVGQGSYTLTNAFARFALAGGHWEIGVYGRNLGNTERLVSSFDFLGAVIGNLGAPRTYGVQVFYRY